MIINIFIDSQLICLVLAQRHSLFVILALGTGIHEFGRAPDPAHAVRHLIGGYKLVDGRAKHDHDDQGTDARSYRGFLRL